MPDTHPEDEPRVPDEPVDPDAPAGRRDAAPAPGAPRPGPLGGQLPVVAVVAVGGVVGALARAGVGVAWPTEPGRFPAATFLVNLVGSTLLSVVVVLASQVWRHRLLRPALGTGVLGGFTTFSTFALDQQHLLVGAGWPGPVPGAAAPAVAVLDLVATLLVCLAGSWAGAGLTRTLVRRGRRRRRGGGEGAGAGRAR